MATSPWPTRSSARGWVDLLDLQGYFSQVDVNWESPHLSRFLRGLALRSRLIITDRRGWGWITTVKEYPEAGQAFLNDHDGAGDRNPLIFVVMGAFAGPSGYHEPSAQDARRRIVAFLDRHLRP